MSVGSPTRCVVLGGGGHSFVLIDCLNQMGGWEVVGILDSDASRKGDRIAGVEVLGGDSLLEDLHAGGVASFALGVGGARDHRPRQRLFDWAAGLGLEPVFVQHPSAIVSPDAKLGRGCQLLPRSVVNAAALLGENVLVNSGAIVEHECRVDAHAHIASGAVLASGVSVGVAAHVGAGAVVRQGLRIGAGAVVGIGAAVVEDVAEGQVVGGVPARPLESGQRSP